MKYFLSAFTIFCLFAVPTAQAFDGVYYLVRHAEKKHDGSRDPALTEEGKKRALTIAQKLKGVKIKAVYSTSYIRTRMTAQPTATQAGVSVIIYDPRNIEAFAKELKQKDGAYLIVGHSNTTPSLVSALAGGKVENIEDHQYDRIFKITVGEDGKGTLSRMYTEPRTP